LSFQFLVENNAQIFDFAKKQIRPAWRAIIIFRPAVRGGPCKPRSLGASTDPAHGLRLRAQRTQL
jgi:hypothetical protein